MFTACSHCGLIVPISVPPCVRHSKQRPPSFFTAMPIAQGVKVLGFLNMPLCITSTTCIGGTALGCSTFWPCWFWYSTCTGFCCSCFCWPAGIKSFIGLNSQLLFCCCGCCTFAAASCSGVHVHLNFALPHTGQSAYGSWLFAIGINLFVLCTW